MKPCDTTYVFKEIIGQPVEAGCNFIKEKRIYNPAQIIPPGFCPALYHAVIPYYVTLANGGWMRWVKKLKDHAKRREIPPNASKIKNMNRLFYNEVIVQCPDSKSSVIVGIGPKGDEEELVMARVLEVKGKCPQNIDKGDIFELRKDGFCLEAFHRLYPYLFIGDNPPDLPFQDENGDFVIQCSCNKGKANFFFQNSNREKGNVKPNNLSDNVDCGNYKNLTVSVCNLDIKCRYHDSSVTYSDDCFASPGLCPDAFHVAYPFALALLYDADFTQRGKKDSVIVGCPRIAGLRLLVQREERHSIFFLKFIKFLEKIFEFFFYPVDKIYNDISLTVVLSGDRCPRNYRIGEKYFLNIRNKEVMCPASFNNIFPQLVRMSYGAEAPNKAAASLHCPDCQGAEYSLEK
jgi:uncharacterized repeat protein (TIGR04076 family)